MDNVYKFRRKRVRQARTQRSQTVRSRIHGLFTLAIIASMVAMCAGAAVAVGVYRSYAHDLKPPEQAIAEATIGTSVAYDRTGVGGTKLWEFIDRHAGLRNPKPLTEISPYLIAATIATEDASFYDNPGVNFRGLARAASENLTPFGPGVFEGSGGSSITQQLAKNVYIGREEYLAAVQGDETLNTKIGRKVKETVVALELKRKYDDHQILEWYLNQIYYGNFSFGAEAASQRFFGKAANDLTLAEAALLAGLPQAPGDYDPTDATKRKIAKQRQHQVLNLMIKHLGEINRIEKPGQSGKLAHKFTKAEIEKAKKGPLKYVETRFDIKAPHFVVYVGEQVAKMCQAGLFESPGDLPCDKVVTQGGLRITTTLDLGLQNVGEKIVEEEIGANEARYGGHDGSLIAIRPGTGELLTYVGSRDFFRADISGQVDISRSLQSHGSTMKVFTYLTAFENGWVPSTYVEDRALYLAAAEGQKQVNNWNYSHLGTITVRKAISESVNTSAVRTVMEVGIDEMRETAHRLGITDLSQGDCGPTITLGACEVQLLDMTFAFSALANNGLQKGRPVSEDLPSGYREIDPVSVLKIEDAEGKVIYQFAKPEQKQVTKSAHAYMITDVLSNEAINWSRLALDRPAAAKTGTSEDFRDGVVMGYTPDLATGVWMGNADNTPMAPGTFSSAGTGPMWRRFMNEAHAYLKLPAKQFPVPDSISTSRCGGRTEVFENGASLAKPGACRAPALQPKPGGPTVAPTPRGPVFPPWNTPTPKPTKPPKATPTPVPTVSPSPSPDPNVEYIEYEVQDGDTLEAIAAKFGVTVEAIEKANDLKPGDLIVPGQILKIPISSSGEG